ncbi:cytochrome c [Tsuneonella sp. CC-YZS046]|uniref:c-type cytochrome n=1 Tax=Tsuneonella sp. CC-YZS046 TaxID=3042152 RepID=UPI002D7A2583|nr:cytochrome c [Tsuneonella sp. CC-YZS046]WRO65862.1 cytochrome c [Tsuneonella sp. CC-YZS046]
MLKVPVFSMLILLVSACSHAETHSETRPAPSAPSAPSVSPAAQAEDHGPARGLAFAQAHCASCHAVARLKISPHPEAPTFEEVVNTPGLNSETLNSWLRNSHNFPEIMGFEIEPDQIDDLAAYMLTLQD